MVVILVSIGIAASLLAYAISPGVRHAVGHAAHSVKHAVVKVFDPDHYAKKSHPRLHLVAPLHPAGAHPGKRHPASPGGGAPASGGTAPAGVAAPTG